MLRKQVLKQGGPKGFCKVCFRHGIVLRSLLVVPRGLRHSRTLRILNSCYTISLLFWDILEVSHFLENPNRRVLKPGINIRGRDRKRLITVRAADVTGARYGTTVCTAGVYGRKGTYPGYIQQEGYLPGIYTRDTYPGYTPGTPPRDIQEVPTQGHTGGTTQGHTGVNHPGTYRG